MAAYVSVYRSRIPSREERERTITAAERDPALRRFLEEYLREESYLDWGDDPSFFAAREFFGDVRRASWGVCRRNLRALLGPGDLVVFFCAKQHRSDRGWDYHFVGFGTVGSVLTRKQVWKEQRYAPYRRFYNLLVRPEGETWVHSESFHPHHDDWERRLLAYILFDPRPGKTEFNLVNPPRVAVYSGAVPERWDRNRPVAVQLEDLLFRSRGIARRLRTSKIGFGHNYMKLADEKAKTASIRVSLNRILAGGAERESASSRRRTGISHS